MIKYKGKPFRCPVEVGMGIISGKWKSLILWHLHEKPIRYKELERIVPGVSQKMLTQQLKEMEADGLLLRKVYPEVPPRVEYALTGLGHSVFPLLEAIHKWTVDNLELEQIEE
ncbi:helix-turn-helix domain-containing protein [Desulfovibrio sp. JC010]|uniref:winged helix-turn-helix transcriptional regulator n=1 Tax=Desulfovibrio sp. JC010 TaxID=2593641 RepID=UPI0013D04F7F|nr:helix-turn-helix domain-containing protein [Desulfovibrio sp. JC010]NDV27414.1 helix-turn-helix transcriptional regulator [Desulfovibrio sp. JC010]